MGEACITYGYMSNTYIFVLKEDIIWKDLM
jgi:hypothetical protein